MNEHIVIAEDDASLRDLLSYNLAKKGFKAFLEALGLELDTKNSGVSIATPSW